MLPTVTIVLAEIIVILLIALGVALYLHFRKNKRHQAELNALMGIARYAEGLPPKGNNPQPEKYPTRPTAAPNSSAGKPADAEFADRTNQNIAEIREAIAMLNAKLGQFRHEHQLRDKDYNHKMEEESAQVIQVRNELHEACAILNQLNKQYASIEQDINNLRVELDRHAKRDAPAVASVPKAPTGTMSSSAKTVHHEEATLIDDFTLPASVLEELEQIAKSSVQETAPLKVHAPYQPAAAKRRERPAAGIRVNKTAATPAPAPDGNADAGSGKKGPVDEPQYAFDPAQIEDLFNVPLFIPGAANTGINVEELNFDEVNLEEPHGLADEPHKRTSYDADRVFHQASAQTGIKAGWYFTLRSGKTHGPFGSKEAGERVLNEMIEQFKRTGDTGGR